MRTSAGFLPQKYEWYNGWWWLEPYGILWLSIYWEDSSHLTNLIFFQRGRSTTNQDSIPMVFPTTFSGTNPFIVSGWITVDIQTWSNQTGDEIGTKPPQIPLDSGFALSFRCELVIMLYHVCSDVGNPTFKIDVLGLSQRWPPKGPMQPTGPRQHRKA